MSPSEENALLVKLLNELESLRQEVHALRQQQEYWMRSGHRPFPLRQDAPEMRPVQQFPLRENNLLEWLPSTTLPRELLEARIKVH